MSFSRAKSDGWNTGDEFTSAQANTIDADHANALDKTAAGDTIEGPIGMGATASITASAEGNIQSDAAGGIQSTTPGGIQLAGGSTDWVTCNPSRTRTILQPLDVVFVSTTTGTSGVVESYASAGASSITIYSGFNVETVNSGSSAVWSYYVPIRSLHNGATLSSVNLYLEGSAGHSNLPSVMPAFGVFRFDLAGNIVPLATGTTASDTSGSVGAYKAAHNWALTCNENNVIDNTQYTYALIIWDEGSTYAAAGNNYLGAKLNYTAIADTRFP